MLTTTTITKRSRLGYGWTNKAVRADDGVHSVIAEVRRPAFTGTLRAVTIERADALSICSGGLFWNEALFVDGRRVVDDEGLALSHSDMAEILDSLGAGDEVTVTLAPGPRLGRPQEGAEAIDTTLSLKVSARQRAALDARAEADGVSVGAVVRAALDAHLNPGA